MQPENGGLILPPCGLRIPPPVHKPLTKYNTLFSANICIVAVLCLDCVCISESFFFLFLRLQQLDEENSELRSCVPCLRANIERLEEVGAIKSHSLAFLPPSWTYQIIRNLKLSSSSTVFFYFSGEEETAG